MNTSFPFIKKFYMISFVLFLLISMMWASCSRNWDNPFDQNKDGESGNNPPSMPIFISPANNSTGQSISTITLEWNASIDPDGDSVTYDIYFGTTNPPGLDITNYSPTTLTKTNLNFETVYYWQIAAKDNQGASVNGNVWNFKTMTQTIPPNPVAYYPFNGNANDESGNGNDGTVYGATLTPDRFGNENRAYSFDGVDDYVDMSDQPTFQVGTGDFSISLWFYFDGSAQNASLVEKRNPVRPFNQYSLSIGLIPYNSDPGKKIQAFVRPDTESGSGGPEDRVVISGETTLGWHHAVMVNDYDSELELYLDGISIETDANSHNSKSINIGGHPLEVGRMRMVDNAYFKGLIDDIRIYNRVLTEEEIQTLYHEGEWVE